jgi:hypothetical protein
MIRRGLFVLGVVAFFTLLARAAVLFFSHHYNVAAEANGLYGILELAEGKKLYPPLHEIPFAIYLYPPFHAALNAIVLKGMGIHSLRPEVLIVRFLSLLFFLASLTLILKQWKKLIPLSFWLVIIAMSFVLPKFFDYITSARQDTLALFLEVAALMVFLGWTESRKYFALVIFIVLCVLSVWTRQTGIAVFISALYWLIKKKDYRLGGILLMAYGVLNGIVLVSLMKLTHGAFWDHVVLANLRGFRPVNLQYFDLSLLSFILNYLPFTVLTFLGLKEIKGNHDNKILLIKSAFFSSASIAFLVFQRAGGDINYFFEAILIGSLFVFMAVKKYSESRVFLVALSLHLIAVSGVYYYKTRSACETAWLPYEEAAEKMKQHFPPYGVIQGGNLAQSLGIHLRGWALHGPDVTNAGFVSRNAHISLRYLLTDLAQKLDRGEIRAYVVADKSCSEDNMLLKGIGEARMGEREVWYPWLCVYERKEL